MSTSFKLSLPIDIPWHRRCVSADMIDQKLCDRRAPFRWRSSLAIFEYEPPAEDQNYEGMTISYLKVTCSITGYQEDPDEIGIERRGLKDFWDDQPGIENYADVLQKYYACYGAILEVTVGPADRNTRVKNFPFIMDFEPKKRELYEVATDTKERQSRSVESLNITKSAGNTQSLEIFDIDMGGESMSQQASFAGTGGGYSYQAPSGQWGTKRLNADESMQSRSADVGQEKRETYSYSTQISQLYHQLDSYHLGTNRAVFFMLPRPHTLETEHTFVNGMRNIEGVQEFVLLVARPKDTSPVCVEAYLETGHIGKIPRWDLEEVPGTQFTTSWTDAYAAKPKGDDDETPNIDDKDRLWEVANFNPGYKITNAYLTSPGPTIRYNYGRPNLVDIDPYISERTADLIRVTGKVHSGFKNRVDADRWEEINYPFTVHISLAQVRVVQRSTDTLFITARSLCCCENPFVEIEGIVYEKGLKFEDYARIERRIGPGVPIAVANQMRDTFKEALMASRSDLANRYSSGLRLSQTSFASTALVHLVDTEKLTLRNVEGLSQSLAAKLAELRPDVGLTHLLTMPFQMQQELFELKDEEVIELRRAITGMGHRVTDPKRKWLSAKDHELLFKNRPAKD